MTNYGNIYSCSDIIIDGKKLDSCRAQSLNGGSCFNGICLCLIGVLGVGAGGYYFYKKKDTKSWTTTQSIENKGIPASVSRHEDRS